MNDQSATSARTGGSSVFLVWLTTFLGWVVTTMDLIIIGFVSNQMSASLHVSGTFIGNAFFLYSLGIGLGALFLGYFSDLFIGRKTAFLYGILGTVIMTGLTGFAQNGGELLAIRFFAGFFSGGEWVMGLAILAEFAPERHRSKLLAATQAGVGFGYGLANTFALTFASPQHLGWRWAYFASFIFALVAYAVRIRIRESPHWTRIAAMKRESPKAIRQGLRQVFSSKQIRYTLLAVVVFLIIGEPQGAWDFAYPAWYLKGGVTSHPIPAVSGYTITYAYEVALVVSTIAGGWFMDRISAKWLLPFVWIAVPFTLLIWRAPFTQGIMPVTSYLFVAGFFRQLGWSIVAAYLVLLFPTRVRGTGLGVTWIAGWILGYAASGYWGPHLVSQGAWSTFWLLQVILLALIPIPMVIAGIETRGRNLDFQDEQVAASLVASGE